MTKHIAYGFGFSIYTPFISGKDGSLIVNPASDRDNVGDKAGNVTLDQNVIATNDVCLVDIGQVFLSYH